MPLIDPIYITSPEKASRQEIENAMAKLAGSEPLSVTEKNQLINQIFLSSTAYDKRKAQTENTLTFEEKIAYLKDPKLLASADNILKIVPYYTEFFYQNYVSTLNAIVLSNLSNVQKQQEIAKVTTEIDKVFYFLNALRREKETPELKNYAEQYFQKLTDTKAVFNDIAQRKNLDPTVLQALKSIDVLWQDFARLKQAEIDYVVEQKLLAPVLPYERGATEVKRILKSLTEELQKIMKSGVKSEFFSDFAQELKEWEQSYKQKIKDFFKQDYAGKSIAQHYFNWASFSEYKSRKKQTTSFKALQRALERDKELVDGDFIVPPTQFSDFPKQDKKSFPTILNFAGYDDQAQKKFIENNEKITEDFKKNYDTYVAELKEIDSYIQQSSELIESERSSFEQISAKYEYGLPAALIKKLENHAISTPNTFLMKTEDELAKEMSSFLNKSITSSTVAKQCQQFFDKFSYVEELKTNHEQASKNQQQREDFAAKVQQQFSELRDKAIFNRAILEARYAAQEVEYNALGTQAKNTPALLSDPNWIQKLEFQLQQLEQSKKQLEVLQKAGIEVSNLENKQTKLTTAFQKLNAGVTKKPEPVRKIKISMAPQKVAVPATHEAPPTSSYFGMRATRPNEEKQLKKLTNAIVESLRDYSKTLDNITDPKTLNEKFKEYQDDFVMLFSKPEIATHAEIEPLKSEVETKLIHKALDSTQQNRAKVWHESANLIEEAKDLNEKFQKLNLKDNKVDIDDIDDLMPRIEQSKAQCINMVQVTEHFIEQARQCKIESSKFEDLSTIASKLKSQITLLDQQSELLESNKLKLETAALSKKDAGKVESAAANHKAMREYVRGVTDDYVKALSTGISNFETMNAVPAMDSNRVLKTTRSTLLGTYVESSNNEEATRVNLEQYAKLKQQSADRYIGTPKASSYQTYVKQIETHAQHLKTLKDVKSNIKKRLEALVNFKNKFSSAYGEVKELENKDNFQVFVVGYKKIKAMERELVEVINEFEKSYDEIAVLEKNAGVVFDVSKEKIKQGIQSIKATFQQKLEQLQQKEKVAAQHWQDTYQTQKQEFEQAFTNVRDNLSSHEDALKKATSSVESWAENKKSLNEFSRYQEDANQFLAEKDKKLNQIINVWDSEALRAEEIADILGVDENAEKNALTSRAQQVTQFQSALNQVVENAQQSGKAIDSFETKFMTEMEKHYDDLMNADFIAHPTAYLDFDKLLKQTLKSNLWRFEAVQRDHSFLQKDPSAQQFITRFKDLLSKYEKAYQDKRAAQEQYEIDKEKNRDERRIQATQFQEFNERFQKSIKTMDEHISEKENMVDSSSLKNLDISKWHDAQINVQNAQSIKQEFEAFKQQKERFFKVYAENFTPEVLAKIANTSVEKAEAERNTQIETINKKIAALEQHYQQFEQQLSAYEQKANEYTATLDNALNTAASSQKEVMDDEQIEQLFQRWLSQNELESANDFIQDCDKHIDLYQRAASHWSIEHLIAQKLVGSSVKELPQITTKIDNVAEQYNQLVQQWYQLKLRGEKIYSHIQQKIEAQKIAEAAKEESAHESESESEFEDLLEEAETSSESEEIVSHVSESEKTLEEDIIPPALLTEAVELPPDDLSEEETSLTRRHKPTSSAEPVAPTTPLSSSTTSSSSSPSSDLSSETSSSSESSSEHEEVIRREKAFKHSDIHTLTKVTDSLLGSAEKNKDVAPGKILQLYPRAEEQISPSYYRNVNDNTSEAKFVFNRNKDGVIPKFRATDEKKLLEQEGSSFKFVTPNKSKFTLKNIGPHKVQSFTYLSEIPKGSKEQDKKDNICRTMLDQIMQMLLSNYQFNVKSGNPAHDLMAAASFEALDMMAKKFKLKLDIIKPEKPLSSDAVNYAKSYMAKVEKHLDDLDKDYVDQLRSYHLSMKTLNEKDIESESDTFNVNNRP